MSDKDNTELETDLELDEDWSMGASTSNTRAAQNAREKNKQAKEALANAKGYQVGSREHHNAMEKHHRLRAAATKSNYHAGNEGSRDDAKQTFDMHMKKAKEHKALALKEELELDEESLGAASLKPNSRTVDDPQSKIEVMKRTLGVMNGMSKGDLTKFYDQAMALIGKEANSLPSGANFNANQNSVDMTTGKGPKTRDAMPKLSVKEDVEDMFAGEELSEEFKDKATTLFEAAVAARSTLELARLEEEFETRLEEQLEEITESVQKNLDTYLGYVVERWMGDNEVAIESALRNEVMEEFIDGLKGLFVEHYIDIPEEKANVVESLAAKVEELEAMLDESINENAELKTTILESNKQEVLDELAEGLTMNQAEKFFALAEGIEFDGDLEVFAKKLSVVKENYFTRSVTTTNLEEETFEEGEVISSASIDPSVNRYVQAISRTVKK